MIIKANLDELIISNLLVQEIGGIITEKDLLNDNKLIYLYKENNTVVGLIYITVYYERSELDYIVVEGLNRRKKIGSSMLNHVISILKENNVENITLEVKVTNKEVISFYEKNKFKSVAKRKGYYHGVDAYLMERRL